MRKPDVRWLLPSPPQHYTLRARVNLPPSRAWPLAPVHDTVACLLPVFARARPNQHHSLEGALEVSTPRFLTGLGDRLRWMTLASRLSDSMSSAYNTNFPCKCRAERIIFARQHELVATGDCGDVYLAVQTQYIKHSISNTAVHQTQTNTGIRL